MKRLRTADWKWGIFTLPRIREAPAAEVAKTLESMPGLKQRVSVSVSIAIVDYLSRCSPSRKPLGGPSGVYDHSGRGLEKAIPARSASFEVAQKLVFSGQRPYFCLAQPEGLGIKEKTT
ncbi:MAG: hypothetical protein ACK5PB_11490 [Pirellula sp.]